MFFVALLIVGFVGWRALDEGNTRASAAMARLVAMGQASDTARSAQVDFKIQVQEWKNILVRGDDQAALDKYRAAFIKAGSTTRDDLGKLNDMLGNLAISVICATVYGITAAILGLPYPLAIAVIGVLVAAFGRITGTVGTMKQSKSSWLPW